MKAWQLPKPSIDQVEYLRKRIRDANWPDKRYKARAERLLEFDFDNWHAKLNQFPQYITVVDDTQITFIHIVNPNPSAKCLLLVHGWPGSIIEFFKIIPTLSEEFHLVIPSLPGFHYSKPVGGVFKIQRLFSKLLSTLGYKEFIVQGGDWGGIIARALAMNDPNCIGCHLNFFPGFPCWPHQWIQALASAILPSPLASLVMNERDRHYMSVPRLLDSIGYFYIQATRPHILGIALNDSPAGLFVWIAEKFDSWAVEPIEDDLLDIFVHYWFSKSIFTSIHIYQKHLSEFGMYLKFSACPTAIVSYHDLMGSPRSWISSWLHVVRYNVREKGHFAALEDPEWLANDIIEFSKQKLQRRTYLSYFWLYALIFGVGVSFAALFIK